MTAEPPGTETARRARTLRWARLLILAAVVVGVVVAIPNTSLGRYLQYDAFQAMVASAGPWGPAAFIAIFSIGSVFLAPASLMAFAAAAVFGKAWGLLWVAIAVNLGANLAFGVGRWAGRDLVASMANRSRKKWVHRIGDMLEESGFMTVLVLRMVFSPYNLMNYVFAVTRLRYQDFVAGTFFGMFPVVFVWVFLGDVLGSVWEQGDIRPLWSWQSVLVAAVFLACLAIPLLMRRRSRLGAGNR